MTKALNQYVGDQVNSRLKSALGDDGDGEADSSTEAAPEPAGPGLTPR